MYDKYLQLLNGFYSLIDMTLVVYSCIRLHITMAAGFNYIKTRILLRSCERAILHVQNFSAGIYQGSTVRILSFTKSLFCLTLFWNIKN